MSENDEDDELPNRDKDSMSYDDQFDGACWDDRRRKLWLLMEDPGTGTAAKIFALVSIMMVVVSVTGMILGSTPEWQITNYNVSATGAKLDLRLYSTLEFVELVPYDYSF
uniref:ERGIC_N domain-containing protein n=1 Tax=Elaeophora elaphi TaxID=1147741 RepID=A0A0R3RNF4_9BILA